MASLIETQDAQLARATVDTIAGGSLLGLKVDLFQTDVPVLPSTPLADYLAAIADFVGYAQKTVTWGTPSVSADGTVEVIGTMSAWRPTNAVTPNVIYGLFARDTTAADLYYAARFDGAPLPMGTSLNEIIATLRYRPATQSLVVTID